MQQDDGVSSFEQAAIQAEFDTGEREGTVEEAKAHIAVRIVRITIGVIVTLLGVAMMVLPGPGILGIAGGLFILAKDVAWADRLLQYMRKRVPGIPDDGKIPRSQVITMSFITLGAIAVSIWWFLIR